MTRALHVCAVHGCPKIAFGDTRCDDHKPPPRPGRGSTRKWREIRKRILARDGYRCTYRANGKRCEAVEHLQVHHILEVQHGGTDADSNLRTLCATHHKLTHR